MADTLSLSIPLKKSTDVDIVKPLKNLIQSTYGAEGGEDYSEALAELARLRTNAIWKVYEKSSLEVVYSYYDQLVSLASKIPPQEVQIPFKWKDAFDRGSFFGGRMSLTVSSLEFERICILFNIAALQTTIASQETLDTEESLKNAAKLFQSAAGILLAVKAGAAAAVGAGEPTPDLAPDTLHALAAVQLAQAHEIIAFKCVRDEHMKDQMVARVCAQGEELYTDAARALAKESVRSLLDRDWPAIVMAKQTLMRGMTQLYQANVCNSNKAVGEAIARLQVAVECLRVGPTHGPAAELTARATRALAAARKDNDFIYHERVPDAALLDPVPRAPVAKPTPLPPRFTNNRDLFEKLVPLAVHAALQAAAARRGELAGAEVAALRDATMLLNSVLASLNLPASLEAAGRAGLPASIRHKAAAVREAGGLAALDQLVRQLPDLLQRNTEILGEAERLLAEEAAADEALRAQFGARWARGASSALTAGLRSNADKYRHILDNAVRADDIVKQKYNTHKENIRLLSGSETELGAGVPEANAGAGAGAGEGEALQRLRTLMDEVESIKAERSELEQELQEVRVDLKDAFLAAAAGGSLDEPALSLPALHAALQPLRERKQRSLQRQEALLDQLQEAHSALMAARGAGLAGEGAGRDAALGALAAAHDAYQELTGNLTEGAKFYNDLTQLLVAFQNKVSDFCFARKTEKEELLKDLTQEASRGSAPPPTNEPAVVAKREPPPRPPPPGPAAAPPAAPPAATAPAPAAAAPALPYPMQPQGMPVPYGAPAAPYPYYPVAPMPAVYNPYATLPYPHHVARAPPHPQYQPYQHPPPQGYQPPPPGYNPYQQQ